MINELTEKIMSNIGLDIDKDFKVKDQDFNNFIIINNKYLKCSYGVEEPFIGKNDIYFDPLNNTRLMIFLFTYFLEKYSMLNNTYFMSFIVLSGKNKTTALDIRGDINIVSDYYHSDTLKYIDIIFRISGYDNLEFLKQYDSIITR